MYIAIEAHGINFDSRNTSLTGRFIAADISIVLFDIMAQSINSVIMVHVTSASGVADIFAMRYMASNNIV